MGRVWSIVEIRHYFLGQIHYVGIVLSKYSTKFQSLKEVQYVTEHFKQLDHEQMPAKAK